MRGMAGDDRSADVASVPMAVNGSGGSQDRDSAELSGDFLADLDAWFASVDGDGGAVDLLPVTPPLAGAIADVGLADSLPVDSISAGSSVHAQPQPLPHKPKNSTQRQKEELQYLRGKASELEAQLKTLKRGRETDPASTEATNNTCAAWKDVAKRQRTARNKAEEEKATLVDTIQRQLKVARGLEKLLSQPAVWDHLQEAQWRKSDLGGQADDQVFARIEQDVDVLCSMLDAVFRHAGLGSSVEDVHETKLSLTSLDGVVLESRHSKLNPFDFRTVEGTVWRSFREGRVKLTNDRVLVLKESSDVVFARPADDHEARDRVLSDKAIDEGKLCLLRVPIHSADRGGHGRWVPAVPDHSARVGPDPACHIGRRDYRIGTPRGFISQTDDLGPAKLKLQRDGGRFWYTPRDQHFDETPGLLYPAEASLDPSGHREPSGGRRIRDQARVIRSKSFLFNDALHQ